MIPGTPRSPTGTDCHEETNWQRLTHALTSTLSPKAWLIEARLQRATRLLADPDATVEKVAGLCGFDCPYHFSRTFKRRFGIPPASYRRVRHIRGFVDR